MAQITPSNLAFSAGGVFTTGGSVTFGFENVPGDPDAPATLKGIFTDSNQTIPATNPQPLDSDAKYQQSATGVLYGTPPFSILVRNSAGVQVAYNPSYNSNAYEVGTGPNETPLNSDLGSSSLVDTGTGPANVPLNSSLSSGAFTTVGTVAIKNVGTDFDQVPLNSNLNYIKPFDNLAFATASLLIKDGDVLRLANRLAGEGGRSTWDVVLASTVTANTYNIVICTGIVTLALVLRVGHTANVTQFGGGNGVADSSGATQAALNYPVNRKEWDSNHTYVMQSKVTHTTASQLRIMGNGCTLKNETHSTNAEMMEFYDAGSCLNLTMQNFRINNDGYRSRTGQIIIRRGNNCSVEHIACVSNSFASTVLELIDPFTCSVKNINYEASGGGIAVKLQGETLNLSTNLIENVFCNAGTPVFVGGEPASGVAQLIETTTLTNMHAVRATGTPPVFTDEENINGSSSTAISVFVGIGPAASFQLGSKIFMGDAGRLEHNYIDSIVSGFLELRYPVIRAAAAGSRVLGGDIGIAISGQSTYGTVLINPHTEAMGVGILASDTKGFQCDSYLAANNIYAIKADAMEEGQIRNIQSFAGADSVAIIQASAVASLGTGRKTNRLTIDGVTNIGGTTVPAVIENASGNNPVFYREGDNSLYVAPTLVNSWANASPSNRQIAGYNKDSFGTVTLRGYINGGSAGTSAFVLPTGFRPDNGQEFACASNGLGKVLVDSAGSVIVVTFTSEIDLSTVSFKSA
jgi:hypothetical protein